MTAGVSPGFYRCTAITEIIAPPNAKIVPNSASKICPMVEADERELSIATPIALVATPTPNMKVFILCPP